MDDYFEGRAEDGDTEAQTRRGPFGPLKPRRRSNTRLVDPALAPDLPELAGPDGRLLSEVAGVPADPLVDLEILRGVLATNAAPKPTADAAEPGPSTEPDPAPSAEDVLSSEQSDPPKDIPSSTGKVLDLAAYCDPGPEDDPSVETGPVPAMADEPPTADVHHAEPVQTPETEAEPTAHTDLELHDSSDGAPGESLAIPGAPLEELQALGGGATPTANELLERAYSGLAPLAARLDGLKDRINPLIEGEDRSVSGEARRLGRKLEEFEPSAVIIGQVKAGKTTLVNALIGRSDLLPADVNPWTSVVTSLHLMSRPGQEKASFRFFDERAWDNLVQRGGRVGELASRAGASDELDKVRAQLETLRDKSRARLGRRFEMLLGQTHDYDDYDPALIERYVCLGDDFWDDEPSSTGTAKDRAQDKGRFADITRSADLWINRAETPLSLCLRDTPGVNDTFMIREQITLSAIRGSRLCVVVLSASQALSTVDLALIRMISTLESRDVVIFVNRIDELEDPARDVPEIRASIEQTLARFEGPKAATILFGSGRWADHALRGDIKGLGQDSAAALLNYAQSLPGSDDEGAVELMWRLSGLEDLGAVMAGRISDGMGAQLQSQIETSLGNMSRAAELRAGANATGPDAPPPPPIPPRGDLIRGFDRIEQAALGTLDQHLEAAAQNFESRAGRARGAFIGRATAALLDHLERYGENEVWSYDPVGLRTLLRSACKVHARDVERAAQAVLTSAARDMGRLYLGDDASAAADRLFVPPPIPEPPAPVGLGQTIALDMRGSWWNRFWRRTRGYAAFADTFASLIEQETSPIIDALRGETAGRFERQVRDITTEFFGSQRQVLLGQPATDRAPRAPRQETSL